MIKIYAARADVPDAVMTATRGPDDELQTGETWRKWLGASVIRAWVPGWQYGDIVQLPFVVLHKTRVGSRYVHYGMHVEDAARILGLTIVYLSELQWEAFVQYLRDTANTEMMFDFERRVIHALLMLDHDYRQEYAARQQKEQL